jgi:hypothetical protein
VDNRWLLGNLGNLVGKLGNLIVYVCMAWYGMFS